MAKTELFARSVPGGVYTINNEANCTGNIFFVGSAVSTATDSTSYGNTPEMPFATLDYAVGKCTANNGDLIVVMPNHAETLATAGAIALDVAGITVKGLGNGDDRPTFTIGTSTSADINLSASNVTLKNIVIVGAIDQLAAPLDVTGSYFDIDIEYRDTSATVEAKKAIAVSGGASNGKIKLKYAGFIAGDQCTQAITLQNASNVIVDVDFYGEASTGVVNFVTTACSNITVNGYFYNDNVALTKNVVDTVTGSTWFAKGMDGKGGYTFSGGSASALASDDVSTIAANQTVATANTSTNTLMRDVIGNKADTAYTTASSTKSIIAYTKGLMSFNTVATASTSTNSLMRDVVGNKTDTAYTTAAATTTKSLSSYVKALINFNAKATANTSTNALLRDVIGNKADTAYTTASSTKSLVAYTKGLMGFNTIATANTSTNAVMRDAIGNKTDTAYTTSTTTKSLMAYVKAVMGFNTVATANTSTNALSRDAIGNKSDTAYTTASSTKSLVAYTKGLIGFQTVATANTSTNSKLRDVVGNKTDTAFTTAAAGTTKSLASYVKALINFNAKATVDTSTNALSRDVIGNKSDAAYTTASSTKSLVAYTKGLMGFQTVATANTSTNARARDTIGNKSDTAYTTASSTKSLVAYTKGLMGFQTVATANTSTNARLRDVVGNKSDTAYTTASSTKSLVAYTKGIMGFNTVATANTSTNTLMRDAIGNKTDSVYTTAAVTTTKSLMSYIKGIFQNVAGNDPNVNRTNYFSVTADMTSATWRSVATHEIAVVSGVNRVRILPVITTADITQTGGVTTISLGTSASTTAFIAATTATGLDVNEIWLATTGHRTQFAYTSLIDRVVSVSDIGYAIANNSASAGKIVFHIWWEPLTATSKVSAGAGGAL